MNIFTLLENKIYKASKAELDSITSLAIGCFDALHLGHFKLINELDSSGALLIIYKKTKEIVPIIHKKNYLKCKIFFINLDEIKDMNAYDFTQNIMYNFTQIKYFVAGYDFHFGKNRAAHARELEKYSKRECKIISEFKIDDISVHSSTIRQLLEQANLALVTKLLGRHYEIIGHQIKGQGLGAKYFVPTINIDYENYYLPKEGVYFAKAFLDGVQYYAAVFLGRRSTDENYALEAHILNNDISGLKFQEIKIEFLDFYRENQRFNDFASLKAKIDEDIANLAKRAVNER